MDKIISTLVPTDYGDYHIMAFSDDPQDKMPHLALVLDGSDLNQPLLVRIHSECLTGDVFSSQKCDCGQQLHTSLEMIQQEGSGVVLYLRQEGRGIGLIEKLKAYKLQEAGEDTIQANLKLGHQADERDYGVAVEMLEKLDISKIRLLTNNPDKIKCIEDSDIELIERVPLTIPATIQNEGYLKTKQKSMGHLLDFK